MRFLTFALLAFAAAAHAADDKTPLDDYLAQLKTLRAQFRQTVTDARGSVVQKADGKFVIVRPGKFRWELTPNTNGRDQTPQLMIADGKNLWFYDRDLEQVSVKPAATSLTATPASLLSGEGDIRELFRVSAAGKHDGFDWVLVTPRKPDADFREARFAFDHGDLRRMVLKDKLGQTVNLDFVDSQRNGSVPDAEVKFTPPAGADVIGTPAT